MPLYQVIVLAIVQSLTEFLPISSTAHLRELPLWFGWDHPFLNSLAFDIALHLGTLLALLAYFYRDWIQLAAQAFGLKYQPDPALAQNRKLLWLLAIATIPVAALGYVFKDQAEGPAWRNSLVIGTMVIVFGFVLYVAELLGQAKRDIGQVSFVDSIVIGAAQALAIVPGVSRSGITISAGLMRNLDRQTAARFSFLLSAPALAGAALKAFLDLRKPSGLSPDMQFPVIPVLVGVLVSAVTGWFVIAFFLRFLRTHTLRFFVYYRIVFGIIVIALAIFVRRTG
ncbi:MAG: undecaprenyl-diphosphate phosphatase [Bryobacteraceae bacterium]|jgi:undecaprenyl-diphosphatase